MDVELRVARQLRIEQGWDPEASVPAVIVREENSDQVVGSSL